MSVTATIRIQEADFDVAQEIAALSKGRTDIGAVVSFSGICRGSENGEPIAALTLEHYPGMAEAEIARHADEALSRWPLQGLTIIHRFGRIAPGENIVLVVTASSHRQAAFEAAEFLMDYLKTNAPFWKREESEKGTSWVEARDHDDARRRALDQTLMAKRTKPAAKRGAGPIETPQGRRRRIADAARFRPLRRQPLHRGRAGVCAWHHRSGCRGRLPGLRGAASAP